MGSLCILEYMQVKKNFASKQYGAINQRLYLPIEVSDLSEEDNGLCVADLARYLESVTRQEIDAIRAATAGLPHALPGFPEEDEGPPPPQG